MFIAPFMKQCFPLCHLYPIDALADDSAIEMNWDGSHHATRQQLQLAAQEHRQTHLDRQEGDCRWRDRRHRSRHHQHLVAAGAQVTVVGQTFRDAGVPGLTFLQADLALMSEAARVAALLPAESADLLIFTAGIFAAPQRQETPEGIERDLAVSYLNRFVILREVAGRLGQARFNANAKPRVFNMAYPGSGQLGQSGRPQLREGLQRDVGPHEHGGGELGAGPGRCPALSASGHLWPESWPHQNRHPRQPVRQGFVEIPHRGNADRLIDADGG